VNSERLLQNYHLLAESDNIDFREFLWDLMNAIERASLTELEKKVIEETFLKPPIAPRRSGGRGKPLGGRSQCYVSTLLKDELAKTVKPSKSKQTEYNGLHRSIKQYKKVLNSALGKIDLALNYGGRNDISPPTLRSLLPKHIGQI
jgi:hypothetical protein